jgi:hypothetical protein
MSDIVTASSVVGWLHSNTWKKSYCLNYSPTLKRQNTSSETSVSIYEAAGRHVPNDINFEVFNYSMVQ